MANELASLINGQSLTGHQIDHLMTGVISGKVSHEQFAGILSILAYRGESAEDVAHFAKSLRTHANIIYGAVSYIDVCGTGGDGHDTFNISTACMFVVAGAGVSVAKHGNRASSSKSGSADVLEALGANLEYDVQTAIDKKEPVVFMFAPQFHPAMRVVAQTRRSLGVPTVFNLIGPLLNPAKVERQVIGTASQKRAELIADAIALLPHKRVGVIYNKDGLDELTTTGENIVHEVHNGNMTTIIIDPQYYNIPRSTIDDLRGGDARKNAIILRNILKNQRGALLDIVLLNSAYALCVAGKVSSMQEGLEAARESIVSGRALSVLNRFVDSTRHSPL